MKNTGAQRVKKRQWLHLYENENYIYNYLNYLKKYCVQMRGYTNTCLLLRYNVNYKTDYG